MNLYLQKYIIGGFKCVIGGLVAVGISIFLYYSFKIVIFVLWINIGKDLFPPPIPPRIVFTEGLYEGRDGMLFWGGCKCYLDDEGNLCFFDFHENIIVLVTLDSSLILKSSIPPQRHYIEEPLERVGMYDARNAVHYSIVRKQHSVKIVNPLNYDHFVNIELQPNYYYILKKEELSQKLLSEGTAECVANSFLNTRSQKENFGTWEQEIEKYYDRNQ